MDRRIPLCPIAAMLMLVCISCSSNSPIDTSAATEAIQETTTTATESPTPTDVATVAAPGREVFRGSQGLAFELPEGWTTNDQSSGITLIPPGGADPTDGVTSETYSVGGGQYSGPDDPTISQELIQIFGAAGLEDPELTGIEPFTKGSIVGAIHTIDGTNSRTERPMEVRAYCVRVTGGTAFVIACAEREILEGRDLLLRGVAASIVYEPRTADRPTAASTERSTSPRGAAGITDGNRQSEGWRQRLAGNYLTALSSYNSGYGGGGMSSQTQYYLGADGTFTYGHESSVSINVDGGSANSSSEGANSGRWHLETRDGVTHLLFTWSDGDTGNLALQSRGEQTWINGTRYYVTPDRP